MANGNNQSAGYRTGAPTSGTRYSQRGGGYEGRAYGSGTYGNRTYGNRTYVEGNTVRKMEAAPQRRPDATPQRSPKRAPQKQPVTMPGISGPSFVFLVMALCVTVCVCFGYLQTQSEVRNMKSQIVTMQSQIAETKEKNDAVYQDIADSVDLSEVYDIATGKLGMVQAVNNQIYTYSSKKSDMVKQYGDIPSAE